MNGGGGGVRGFNFVKTPSPCPGAAGESPMMTWGEIEGTPFRLDGSDTPIRPSTGPSFRIMETSRRENIALELAEKASERLRGQKAKAMEMARRNMAASSPHIRSSLDRMATMSPAAKRLASSRLVGMDGSIMSSSSSPLPSPKSRTASPMMIVRRKTPLVKMTKGIRTPTLLGAAAKKVASAGGGSKSATVEDPVATEKLTDDLLRIPTTRQKASDFF